jgi:hypothetical protein
MALRFHLGAHSRERWLGLLLLTACASVPKLIPAGAPEGHSDATLAAAGIQVRVVANAWRGSPHAVEEQFTPIWVHLVNTGNLTYDFTYTSFTLIDETGRLYAAMPPMEVVKTLTGSLETPLPESPLAGMDTVVDPAEPGPTIQTVQFGFGMGFGPNDPFYSPDPYMYPPTSYEATGRVLSSGLREGRLLPRTHALGFLYFQRAYDAHELTLRIEAASETPGQPPAAVSEQFRVDH